MALRRLKRDGLVTVSAEGRVHLTGEGREIARRLTVRHHLIERMLHEIFPEESRQPAGAPSDLVTRALEVLTGLGYSSPEAREAVRQASAGNGGSQSVEELVTVALRGLDRG